MTRHHSIFTLSAMLTAWLVLLFTSCSSESNDTPEPEQTLAPLQLYISVPQVANGEKSRSVGDPGEEPVDETLEKWDRLTIIVAYTSKTQGDGIVDSDPKKMVYYDTFTKKDFEEGGKSNNGSELSPDQGNGLHTYTMYLPLGTVRVYGVTYTDGAGLDIEKDLDKIAKDGNAHNSDVLDLKISNDYANATNSTNANFELNQFLSVATGYAVKVNTDGTLTTNRDITISKKSADLEDKYWRMPLTRLATKLDIQWDAKEAYVNDKYTDVTVNSIEYNGGASNLGEAEKSGYGRLFPTLQSSEAEAVGGVKTFINSTAISKRNGRVYHYFFPDGSNKSAVVFNLSLTPNGQASQSATYPHQFGFVLEPAVWYKLNATIKGTPTSQETRCQVVQNTFQTGN